MNSFLTQHSHDGYMHGCVFGLHTALEQQKKLRAGGEGGGGSVMPALIRAVAK